LKDGPHGTASIRSEKRNSYHLAEEIARRTLSEHYVVGCPGGVALPRSRTAITSAGETQYDVRLLRPDGNAVVLCNDFHEAD
jgi:hypothetical protein